MKAGEVCRAFHHDVLTHPCILQETDAMTAAIKEMGIEFPALLNPLIYERDLYMVKQLRSIPPRYGSLTSCYSRSYYLSLHLQQQCHRCCQGLSSWSC